MTTSLRRGIPIITAITITADTPIEFLTSTADPAIVLDTVCALFPMPGIIETALNKTDILSESLNGSIRLFIPLSPRKNISIPFTDNFIIFVISWHILLNLSFSLNVSNMPNIIYI